MVRHHHRVLRWDRLIPIALKASSFPTARVLIAIADAYDTGGSGRSLQENARSPEDAFAEARKMRCEPIRSSTASAFPSTTMRARAGVFTDGNRHRALASNRSSASRKNFQRWSPRISHVPDRGSSTPLRSRPCNRFACPRRVGDGGDVRLQLKLIRHSRSEGCAHEESLRWFNASAICVAVLIVLSVSPAEGGTIICDTC